MNFEESVKYLYSLGNEVLAMKLGLENIGALLEALGNPQNNYLKVQIAGTNGKGSTVAFLESICREAGIVTGATTSPHLISVTERVRINGTEIGEADFARQATVIRQTSERLVETGALESVPTYFEQVTAIALNAFAEAKIELAILETGLGGRFDATTAARAEIVGITPIDYDHQRILGDTLAEIASEKAAIIREDSPVVVAPQMPEAENVILEKCRAVGVEPIFVSEDYQVKKIKTENGDWQLAVKFSTDNDVYHDMILGLAGRHQVTNALVAVSLAEILRDFGFAIEKECFWKGLKKARHRGRLEFYKGILFDGAHNAGGARALREYLDEFVEKPITMIFAIMRDKDIVEVARLLIPKADRLILTRVEGLRSAETREFVEILPPDYVEENFDVKLFFADDAEKALKKAEILSPKENLILVTGSLYLIGEAQKILRDAS